MASAARSIAASTATYAQEGLTPDALGHTLEGYPQRIVVNDKLVLKVSYLEEQLARSLRLSALASPPILPLRHWKVGPNMKLGIVGIGGLATWALARLCHGRTSSPS
jgi:D-arabinose 1-dehydrogenase-like Zn-dependent alcohol dehydrogenase